MDIKKRGLFSSVLEAESPGLGSPVHLASDENFMARGITVHARGTPW